MPGAISSSANPIVLSSSDSSDVDCVGQRRGAKPTVPPKREATTPSVSGVKGDSKDDPIDISDDESNPGPTVPSRSGTTSSASSVNRALRGALEGAKEQHRIAQASLRRSRQPNNIPSTSPSPISILDSDEEEDRFAAYDLNNPANWAEYKGTWGAQPARDIDKEITSISEEMALLMPKMRRERGKAAVHALYSVPASSSFKPTSILQREGKKVHVWRRLQYDMANTVGRNRDGPHNLRKKSCIPATRFLMAAEEVRTGFAPGAINSIAQADGFVAVASCALGGEADDEGDSTVNMPYNNAGSLKVMYGDNVFTLHGHEGVVDSVNETRKHYTVNDVQFDPTNPTRLVSCGRDRKIIIWDCDTRDYKPKSLTSHLYDSVPEGLQFKPGNPVFVSWTSLGQVGIHNGIDTPNVVNCAIKPEPIQSLLWGRGRSQHMVYLTTQVAGATKCTGKHMALDVEYRQNTPFTRKLDGGECLDIDSLGTRLAHVTCKNNRLFTLSLYDPQANHKRVQEITLPGFNPGLAGAGFKPSVTQVLFSPDSVYLAVARSDNVTHVYDSRFLNQSFLYDLPHGPAVEATEEDGQYGIAKIEWLEDRTQGLNLVTCGADGCVRLWDVKRAHDIDADTVIAKSVSYAGWFSLGDTSREEKALILGDGSGNLVVKE